MVAKKSAQRVDQVPAPGPFAEAPAHMSDRAMNVVAAVLLAASLGVLYLRVADAPFLFDDEITVETNESLRRLWPLVGDDQLRGPLNPAPQLPTAGRPVVNLAFALNYAWGGVDPAGYRIVNLVLHFLSAMLLMLVVRRTLRQPCFNGRFDAVAAPLALLVALLWAVHPLQTESVAYITQRTELLVGLCYLATFYCALRYWESTAAYPPARRGVSASGENSHSMLWLALAICASAAGMASKEIMVTVPAVVLLYDWTFVGRSLPRIARDSWQLYAGLIATWLVLFFLNVGGPRSASTGFQPGFSPWVWWATQSKIFWMYLKLVVWPSPLVIHYEFPRLDTWSAALPWVLPTVLLLGLTFVLLWRQSAVGFVAASVMVILSPTSIIPILSEVAAERRMYLPLALLLALAVVAGYLLAQKLLSSFPAARDSENRRPLAAVGVGVLSLALVASVLSARRLNAYVAVTPLWEDALVHQPDNYTVNYNLAGCLVTDKRYDEALERLRHTVAKWPDHWRGHLLLGVALSRLERMDEAISAWQKAVELKPDSYDTRIDLGAALTDAGQYDEAIVHLSEAARMRPNEASPQIFLGLAYSKSGRPEQAVEHYQKAIALDHENADAHNNLGVAYIRLGRPDDAQVAFERAVELRPEFIDAQNNLARLQERSGDMHEAIRLYEQTLLANPDSFPTYSKLTEAYVRTNQPDKAIATAEKAAELARTAGQTAAAKQIDDWLREYRAQQASPPPPADDSPAREAPAERDSSAH